MAVKKNQSQKAEAYVGRNNGLTLTDLRELVAATSEYPGTSSVTSAFGPALEMLYVTWEQKLSESTWK